MVNKERCFWGKWKGQQSPGIKPRTPGLHSTGVLGSIASDCWSFTFLYFHLKNSNLSLFQRETKVPTIKTEKNTQNGFSLDGENFPSTPTEVLMAHSVCLPGVRLRLPSVCIYKGWWLSSCRSSVAEHWQLKPGVLVLIPSDCQPFHFPLFSPQKHLNFSLDLRYTFLYL